LHCPDREGVCMEALMVEGKQLIRTVPGERFTPFSLAKKLGAKVLLESASFIKGRERYSILLIREAFSVFQNRDGIFMRRDGKSLALKKGGDDILDVLSYFAGQHRGFDPPFPFPAGGIGYLSYEYATRFDDVKLAEKVDPLAIPAASFLFGHVFAVFDHYLDSIALFGINYKEHRIDLDAALRETEEKLNDLDFNYMKSQEAEYPALAITSEEDRREYVQGVKKVKEEIVKGNLLQGVLSRRVYLQSTIPALAAYKNLRSFNPSPYLFYLDFGEFQLFGSSPEVHVKAKAGRAVLRPIAGTRRRGATAEEDQELEKELLSDEKERAEHLMLVDLARNDLGRICEPGSVRVTENMGIEHYSHVMHIVSEVEGRLRKGNNGVHAIRATFPAGTVTGAPKIRAMEIIDGLEKEKRSFYAGIVGYMEPGGSVDSCIVIRSALKRGKLLVLQAGAGIVYDSDPEREFEETQAKLGALGKAIGVEV
jgi:anthranilate synthase component 1